MNYKTFIFVNFFFFVFISISKGSEREVNIAVSSNFRNSLIDIINEYNANRIINENNLIKFTSGSTVNLYHQILNGAPFDLFLSADSKHPSLLQANGFGEETFTYACGKLVFWSKKPFSIEKTFKEILSNSFNSYIAIPNPKTAPYGVAANEVISNLGMYNELKSNLIRGINVSQVVHFVKTKSVDRAFIALSQVKYLNKLEGQYTKVPKDLYHPIKQDVILLRNSKNKKVARDFFYFLTKNKTKDIIQKSGYDINC